ncbi:uncharacterized protein LOC116425808 [Nomia melanderi]|uniref:uncharacterized protein LOC116425808 n=1 Tax=Nomia melanderi TaxID=2448451 RepID=UPI0013041621|nr:uncharacterized protein LOC116425808 [Nomia melanderi]XP_031829832.1 uncharacterized protein LOC116425808 [Nomia melanderi]XP_031829833.1 uncharacterized protein LOC116425808 [Nomia melanderi]XP_031829834.1 uncharacterized protein LOC116425808 [Nomia melanderi]
MQGIRRILVFCVLTTILPIILLVIPLYLRHNFYANVAYTVTESGILEITDGVSTIFCSEHTIQMNRSFNAFQVSQKPEITSYRKHIRLKKSMTIPDDTLEYWGFYLLQGASVALSVCSRFEGASILLVKGERNLRTCGMLEHNYEEQIVEDIFLPKAEQQVKVIFTSNTREPTFQKTIPKVNGLLRNMENVFPRDNQSDVNNEDLNNSHKHMRNSTLSNKEIRQRMLQDFLESTKTRGQPTGLSQEDAVYSTKKLRHSKKKQYPKTVGEKKENHAKLPLQEHIVNNIRNETETENTKLNKKVKRSQDLIKPPFLLDEGVKHGGNAVTNVTNANDVSSVSSFENGLFKCYGGSILIAQEFAPSKQCTNVSYLLNGKHMQTIQNIVETGYYYYIFYSDNDIVSNDIHAVFDIYKPLLQYENVTKSCMNQTKCSFTVNFLSSDRVIVEIPTKDDIEYVIDNDGLLLSVCHPRMEVYVIFPIAVLFFILTCAFM